MTRKKTAKVRLIEILHGGTAFEKLLQKDFERGLSPRQLQVKYDMHFTVIYDYAREFGLKPPGRAKRDEELTAAR